MRVALIKADPGTECTQLSKESLDKLEAAFIFATKRERDFTMVLAFVGYYTPSDFFQRLKQTMEEKYNVEFLTTLSDVLVLRTENMDIITVKMCGGSILFVPPTKETHEAQPKDLKAADPELTPVATNPKKRARTNPSSKKRRRESNEPMGELTQECAGLL